MSDDIRILIIDDDPGIRETYQTILGARNVSGILSEGARLFGEKERYHRVPSPGSYDICLARDGDEGVRLVNDTLIKQEPPFAVAFVDMKMPGPNGAETAKRIWTLDEEIRMVVVTAFSEFTPDDIIRQTGRDDVYYLRKPFHPEEIRQFARVLSNEWLFDKERKRLAQHLQDANRDLREKVEQQAAIIVQSEKMASIGILAAGVAHEINNPNAFISVNVSTMKTYAQTLSELLELYGQLEAAIRLEQPDMVPDILDRIESFKKNNQIDFILNDMIDLVNESLEGTERIKGIVNDLRTFSRVDETEYREIDINETINATLSILANELDQKAVVEKEFSQLPLVHCCSRKISQVFLNMLMNAIQAIDKHGLIRIATRSVDKGRREEDLFVEIIIADTGKGISEKHMNRLFDPFFTTRPVGQGTGLGLSIVYDIIAFHKGEIFVDSRPGEGTTFTVRLPVRSVKDISH